MEDHRLYRDVVKPRSLDDKFGELMDANTDARHRERLDARSGARPGRALSELSGRLSRLLMHHLGQICLVDLYGGRREFSQTSETWPDDKWRDEQMAGPSGELLARGRRPSPSMSARGSAKPPRWARLIRWAYCYCVSKFALTVYHQYRYDLNAARHQRLSWYTGGAGGEPRPALALEAPKFHKFQCPSSGGELKPMWSELTNRSSCDELALGHYARRASEARATLRLLGAPYMHLKFSIEWTYIFFILVSLGIYVQTHLYFAHVTPFDYTLVRSIMDFRRELRLCNRLIRVQLNKFIESSRMFTSILILAGGQPPSQRFCSCQAVRVPSGRPGDGEHRLRQAAARGGGGVELRAARARRALEEHSLTVRQLEQMALSGALVPANKGRAWVDGVGRAISLYTIAYLSYGLAVVLFTTVVMPARMQAPLETAPMDLLALAELLFIFYLVLIASTFWGSLILATTLDQVHLVRELKRKIDRSLRVNTARFHASQAAWQVSGRSEALADLRRPGNSRPLTASLALVSGRRGSRAPTGLDVQTQMNGDLLELLLSYKIFVAQLEPLKRSYAIVTLTTYTLIILMPVLGRIHVPYVDDRIKLYVGILNVLCTIACDLLILIPMSYLYTRCLELHKSLASVLAHTVQVSQAAAAAEAEAPKSAARWTRPAGFRVVYNEHTVFALRKELRHPECLADQFATSVPGMRLTYGNLLKIHFWIGFVTQSFVFESAAAARGEQPRDLLGSVFADPLGLF